MVSKKKDLEVCRECGGFLYGHGTAKSKAYGEAPRFICKDCRKSITVRDGKIVEGTGRPRKVDWRSRG